VSAYDFANAFKQSGSAPNDQPIHPEEAGALPGPPLDARPRYL
jgi:hypothetical protein